MINRNPPLTHEQVLSTLRAKVQEHYAAGRAYLGDYYRDLVREAHKQREQARATRR